MVRFAIQSARKKAFLKAFSVQGVISHAAARADIGVQTVRDWRKNDPKFAEAFLEAEELACDRLEMEADRRAHDGVEKFVVSHGKVVMYAPPGEEPRPLVERTYSDTLLMLLLRARRPDKYRDRSAMELTGKNGGQIEVDSPRDRIARKLSVLTTGGDAQGDPS